MSFIQTSRSKSSGWVAGAFMFFTYPERVWHLFGREATLAQIRRTRRIGALGLWVTLISLIGTFAAGFGFADWPPCK